MFKLLPYETIYICKYGGIIDEPMSKYKAKDIQWTIISLRNIVIYNLI